MADYTIKGQFEAKCPTADVMRWLDSSEGIAGWWSDSIEGSASSRGNEFTVSFPTTDVPFQLEVVEVSDEGVAWHISENPPWWKDTTIRFDLSESDEGGTSIMFTHSGFDPDDPIIPAITPAWVRFVDNLVSVAESGDPNPAVVN